MDEYEVFSIDIERKDVDGKNPKAMEISDIFVTYHSAVLVCLIIPMIIYTFTSGQDLSPVFISIILGIASLFIADFVAPFFVKRWDRECCWMIFNQRNNILFSLLCIIGVLNKDFGAVSCVTLLFEFFLVELFRMMIEYAAIKLKPLNCEQINICFRRNLTMYLISYISTCWLLSMPEFGDCIVADIFEEQLSLKWCLIAIVLIWRGYWVEKEVKGQWPAELMCLVILICAFKLLDQIVWYELIGIVIAWLFEFFIGGRCVLFVTLLILVIEFMENRHVWGYFVMLRCILRALFIGMLVVMTVVYCRDSITFSCIAFIMSILYGISIVSD